MRRYVTSTVVLSPFVTPTPRNSPIDGFGTPSLYWRNPWRANGMGPAPAGGCGAVVPREAAVVPSRFGLDSAHDGGEGMPLLGWIVALIGFLGVILTVAPVIDLPTPLRFSIPVWAGVCIVGLLVAMFTRRGKD